MSACVCILTFAPPGCDVTAGDSFPNPNQPFSLITEQQSNGKRQVKQTHPTLRFRKIRFNRALKYENSFKNKSIQELVDKGGLLSSFWLILKPILDYTISFINESKQDKEPEKEKPNP